MDIQPYCHYNKATWQPIYFVIPRFLNVPEIVGYDSVDLSGALSIIQWL